MKIRDWVRNKAFEIILALLIGAIAIGLYVVFSYLLHKENEGYSEYREREKRCYNELTSIIEKNPRDKREWIEKTIIAEKMASSATSYCWVLELVRETQNSERGDAGPTAQNGKKVKRVEKTKSEK